MLDAISGMVDGFPMDVPDGYVSSLTAKASGYSNSVVIETCERFGSGKVEGHNPRFVPTVAEWCKEADKVAEWQEIRNRPPVERPEYRPVYATADDRRRASMARFTGRDILAENIKHTEFVKQSRRRAFPAGSTYSAALGIVFGPVKAAQQQREKEAEG